MSIYDNTIKEFKKLDLHDQEIERLEFDFSEKKIRVFFSLYEESVADYIVIAYEFSHVHILNISQMELKEFLDLEIHSFEVIARTEGDFSFRLEVLQGIGEPSSVISFLFRHHRRL